MLKKIIAGQLIAILIFATNVNITHAHSDNGQSYIESASWSKKITAKKRFRVLSAFNGQAVLDRETGLVWERTPDEAPRTWYEAMGDCRSKNVGERLGWRLPAIEELASLVDPMQTQAPFLPTGHPFNNVLIGGQVYYSATTIVSTPPNAMGMRPYDGSIRATLKNIRDTFVWCVRGGYGPGEDGQ